MATTATQNAIDRYSDMIAHLTWCIVQDREETHDICQETFLRFCAARDRGEEINAPGAWLRRTALNLAIDAVRRRDKTRRYQAWQQEDAGYTGPDGDTVERRLLVEQVRQLALQLPDRQREVFILRNFDDLSYTEIGAVVGCSPETARVHEYQAIRKIRSWLDVRPDRSRSERR